jgi:uncharacterized lipoprotein YmbA
VGRSARRLASAGGILTALLAVACGGGGELRFYTLTKLASVPVPVTAAYEIEILSVEVPAQVDVPQIVIREGAGQLTPVESRRWIAPLASEARRALSQAISRHLQTRDIRGLTRTPGYPVYRIKMQVERFDSSPGQYARIDAVWSVRELAANATTAGPSLLCSSSVHRRAEEGYDALAEAHQKALEIIGLRIAWAIEDIRRNGKRARCPAVLSS